MGNGVGRGPWRGVPSSKINAPRRLGTWNLELHVLHFSVVLFPFRDSINPPRVVITGAGIITALGNGWKPNADGFRAGRPAMRPVSLFDASRQRVKTAA